MKAKLALLAVLAVMPAIASAQRSYFETGNDLMTHMAGFDTVMYYGYGSSDQHQRYGLVLGYTTAVYAALGRAGAICIKERPALKQIAAVVSKWMHANPARWGESAFELTGEALRQGFPCATPESGPFEIPTQGLREG